MRQASRVGLFMALGTALVSLAWFWMLREVDSVLTEDHTEQIRRSGGA